MAETSNERNVPAPAGRRGPRLYRFWNWKAGLASGLLRAPLLFTVNAGGGLAGAAAATLTEFVFRVAVSGVYGALTQAVREVRPSWLAGLTVGVALPATAHLLQYAAHAAGRTPRPGLSVAVSVVFTILAALFNWHVMRHGAMLAGPGGAGLGQDLRRMPGLLWSFLAAGPRALRRLASLFSRRL